MQKKTLNFCVLCFTVYLISHSSLQLAVRLGEGSALEQTNKAEESPLFNEENIQNELLYSLFSAAPPSPWQC